MCTTGAAICLEGRAIDCVVVDGGFAAVDRSCPPSSGCSAGRCVAASGAQVCATSRDCGVRTCAPLIDPGSGTLATFCAEPRGLIAGGEPCTRDVDCTTSR